MRSPSNTEHLLEVAGGFSITKPLYEIASPAPLLPVFPLTQLVGCEGNLIDRQHQLVGYEGADVLYG
ncbi:hypothetical protein HCG51_10225 [Tolypothrix sp. PCC 7910]|uniref:hypothetical protein n=1 Tax=Tolypothrix sp. PCC 7910 TaxID=2099387 RepID=UPI00142798F8|nr:hypothetical protein [Tolypothrix sp. PCC 7910]QIR37074.1 hypothetical protein HCG51_10225 [Tolypothrix sp. PCC 7910]